LSGNVSGGGGRRGVVGRVEGGVVGRTGGSWSLRFVICDCEKIVLTYIEPDRLQTPKDGVMESIILAVFRCLIMESIMSDTLIDT
jgi:hypothetical protein